MPHAARFAALIVTMLLVFVTAQFELFHSLGSRLADIRFAATSRPVSGQIVMVDINSASIAEVGVWPWPRHLDAELLDKLVSLDAAEIVFDVDFSTASNAADDAAFAAALERAGGYAFLAAFQQQAHSGGAVATVAPLAQFRAFAEPVSVNVVANQWDEVTAVQQAIGTSENAIPSIAAALNMRPARPDQKIAIDYGLDLSTIDRISAADVLAGRIDPKRIAGKQVVIGASAIELHDLFQVPRFGRIPGALLQIAAAETVRADRALTVVNGWPIAVAAIIAGGVFLLLTAEVPLGIILAVAVSTIVIIEAVSYPALALARVVVPTAAFHVAIAICTIYRLADALGLRQAEKRRQEKRLAFLAHHDVLTGALNRQSLVDRMDAMLAEETGVTLIAVDVGRVGIVNSALGHEVGDQLLAEIAARLQAAQPQALGRTGGSIFALAYAGEIDAAVLDETLSDIAVILEAPYHVDGHTALVSVRFGTASACAGQTGAQLLRFAHIALSRAAAIEGRHVAFAPEMQAAITERQVLDVAMRRSLADGDFFLLYQPQISLTTGEVVGVEALVRWRHPDLGIISPATFIPLAEETGAIVELGEFILNRACSEAASWAWTGKLAVNVSAVQFRLGDVPGAVKNALAASGLPASRLDVEITESLFVDNAAGVLAELDLLREHGIGIAIDDFGTGYSSLSYLTRLPVDKLKIDQSFVRRLPHADSGIIVETIISMAQRLGKTTVAEGIETIEQQTLLAQLGCQIGQGYLFSKPLPVAELKTFLENARSGSLAV